MDILRRLPFSQTRRELPTPDGSIVALLFQIIVPIGLSIRGSPPTSQQVLPAVLDTGHNHNFSIAADQFLAWTGQRVEAAAVLRTILVNGQQVPLREIDVWLFRNRPGSHVLMPRPVRLPMPEGVAVYPAAAGFAPRLPLLGLRALVREGLRLAIDGERLTVTLRRP